MRNHISTTQPHRIPLAGKVDVVCFDKTGTITEEALSFQGVVMPEGARTALGLQFVAMAVNGSIPAILVRHDIRRQ